MADGPGDALRAAGLLGDREPVRHGQHDGALGVRAHPRDRDAPDDRHDAPPGAPHDPPREHHHGADRRRARPRARAVPLRARDAGASDMDGLPFTVPSRRWPRSRCSPSSPASARRSCRRGAPRGSTCWRRCSTSSPRRQPTTANAPAANRPRGRSAYYAARVSGRQEQILGLVEQHGFVRVADLASRFGVSTVTVRSDLAALESHGRLRRVRGGAVPPSVLRAEQPYEVAAAGPRRREGRRSAATRRASSPTATRWCSTSGRPRRRSPARSSPAATCAT